MGRWSVWGLVGVGLAAGASGASQLTPAPTVADLLLLASLVLLLGAVVLLARRARAGDAARAELGGLLEAVPDGVLTVRPDGTILSVNSRAEQLFGFDAGTLAGQPVKGLFPARVPEAGPLADVAAHRRDGTAITVEAVAAPWPGGRRRNPQTLVVRDVTQARRTEELLRTRDAHLGLVVEQMPAILWTTDRELRITSTLGAGLAALNMDPHEVVGMSMLECLDRDDVEATPIAAHLRALHGESLNYEMEWRGRSFQVRVEPLRGESRKITGTIGIVLDVTDRKQAVAQLRARLGQQQAVAKLGQQSLQGASLDRLLAEAAHLIRQTLNVEFCEVLERQPAEGVLRVKAALGWGERYGVRAEVNPAGASPAAHALRTGDPVIVADFRTETLVRLPQPLLDHGIVAGICVPIAGKEEAVGVLGVYSATARVFGADDLHFLQALANTLASAAARRRAEEAQQRLTAILEATPDCVAIAGTDRRLLYLNRAGRALLGTGPDADVSQTLLADLYRPGDSPPCLKAGTGVVAQDVWTGEAVLRDHAGREVPVSQVSLVHRSPAGTTEFFSVIARDVSERRRLEEELRQAQKMEAVGRLAGGIAHDFNNLLTIIGGNCDLLRYGLPGNGPWGEHLSEVRKATGRAAALTRQLLAFSRKQIFAPRTVHLGTLVTQTEQMLRRLIGEDVELVTVPAPDLAWVRADPSQIEQILLNLCVNARDAMPTGGRLSIATENAELDAHRLRDFPEALVGRYVLLAVTDTGCGMTEEVKRHIFEPFFTTKEVGKGTGLGLATVYGIVKQSGGHVEVDSTPGKGTTFRLFFPAVDEEVAAPTEARAPAAVRRGKETLLLVEDEEGVRLLARQVLHQHGYRVLEARNGEEALAAAERFDGPIDLLLTDVVMPRLSGSELVRRLLPVRADLRVLFMSGFTDTALVRHEIQTGEVNCLMKPFSPEDLALAVREALDGPAGAAPRRGESLLPRGGGDRRTNLRRRPRRTVTLEVRSGLGGTGENLVERLIDLSPSGVGVLLGGRVEKGQETETVLSGGARSQPLKLKAEVVWVRPAGEGRFRAGLRFHRRLGHAEYRDFVE